MMKGGISRRSNEDRFIMKTIQIIAAAAFATLVVAVATVSAAGPGQSHCDMAGHNTGTTSVSDDKLDRRQITASPKALANFPNLAAQTSKQEAHGMACCQGKMAATAAKHCDMAQKADAAPSVAKP
jgi:hypothetical protein